MSRTTRWRKRNARITLLSSIGCVLFFVLCASLSATGAAASKSAPAQAATPSDPELADSLVVPSVDQLLGGEQAQSARSARRDAPAAIARRRASHAAFEGLSTSAALSETKRAFPALLGASAAGVPQLSSGERIVRYPTSNAAEAPGLQAAREQAAYEAAMKAAIAGARIIDPEKTMNRTRARAMGETFLNLQILAEVGSLLDVPAEVIDLAGSAFGAELGLNDAFSWLSRAGQKLIKCSENNRSDAFGKPLNICQISYAEIEVEIIGYTIAKFIDFAIEPNVTECTVPETGGAPFCSAEVHIPAAPQQE